MNSSQFQPDLSRINEVFGREMLRMDRFMVLFVAAHWPVAALLVPWGYGTHMLGLVAGGGASLLAVVGFFLLRGQLALRVLNGTLLMVFSSLFITQQFGRIEMHFHIFGCLAFLIMYRDWRVYVGPVLYVVLHHGLGNYCQSNGIELAGIPIITFNYGAGWDIVLLHAVFVVFEVSVLIPYSVHLRRQFSRQQAAFQELEYLRESERIAFETGTKQAVESLDQISTNLAESSSKLSDRSQSQASSMEEMAAGLEQAAASIEGIGNTTGELDDKIRRAAARTGSLAESAREMAGRVHGAADIVRSTNEGASQTNQTQQTLSGAMQRVRDSSIRMTEILAIIEDIADKVNLLSLNASIEAARAGDSGRGFSVVAQEISRLADRTAQSTKEIRTLIDSTGQETKASTEAMEQSNRVFGALLKDVRSLESIVSDLSSAVEQQSVVYDELAGELSAISDRSAQIRESMGEQKSSVEEMVRNVENVNRLTEETAHAAEQLSVLSQQNRETTKKMTDLLRSGSAPRVVDQL